MKEQYLAVYQRNKTVGDQPAPTTLLGLVNLAVEDGIMQRAWQDLLPQQAQMSAPRPFEGSRGRRRRPGQSGQAWSLSDVLGFR